MASSIIFPRTTELPAFSGTVTATIDPPTDVTVTNTNDSTTSGFTIPAGAVTVTIENRGGESPATATVNGDNLAPGARIERTIVYDGVNRYLLPAFVVVTNGTLIFYSYDA